MRGIGSRYDYDALAYQPDDEKKSESYFAATPCRATLHAETVKARSTLLPDKPTSALRKLFGSR